uniref:Protein FYV10 n=1 Tax=Talaromyces marneffei PM1 TaxID=1077442 RepID=A0A093X6B0_TALMA
MECDEQEDIPSSPTTKSMSPPLDAYRIGRHVKRIEKDLDEIKEQIKDISPNLERRVRRIMKSSIINAHLQAQNKTHINQLLDLNRRKAKAKSRRQILNVGGVLSVRDANKRIDARRAEEIKKKWRIEERARKRRIRQAKETASRIAQNNDMCAIIDAQITSDTIELS